MSSRPEPEERYAGLVEALREAPGVTPPASSGSPRFGAAALKVDGKIFAMLTHGSLVLKLPRKRVEALIAAGQGSRFDPGHGRLMKEWLRLDPDADVEWLPLAREALALVGGA